jgi:uncharacterized protein (DUF1499 family)
MEIDQEDWNDDEITPVTYALVLKIPLESIPRLKELIMGLPRTEIVYQKKSLKHLFITDRESVL